MDILTLILALSLLLLPILWLTSISFQYTVKICVYYCLIGLASVVTVCCTFYRPVGTANSKITKKATLFLTKIYNIGWHTRGDENLKSDKPMILVCNHQSSLDLMGVLILASLCSLSTIHRGMMTIWPDKATPMIKKELMYAGTFGLAGYFCGAVYIDRFNKQNAMSSLQSTLDRIKNEHLKLWVFPEGTRNHESKTMLPFKKGAFHLAVQAQIPVVPIVFSDYGYFYSKKNKKFDCGGQVIISVLPPISTVGLEGSEAVTELADRVRAVMMDEFVKISDEAEMLQMPSSKTGKSKSS